MPSVNWRQVGWISIALHALYVWIVGLAVAFLARVMALANAPEFEPVLIILVALATVWAANRVALQADRSPMLHGLLVGLLVGLIGLILTYLSIGVGVADLLGFLLQILGGLLGGRMAQRMLSGEPR